MLHWSDPWFSGGTILPHQPQEEQTSHFSRQEKANDCLSPAQAPQTIGSLQPVGPGCPKAFTIGITLFVQSVWDYPPRNPSVLGKQRHGLQLIAQLHSLPTLSKINSHHASNLCPSLLYGGSCQTSLQRVRGGCAAPSRADPTFPSGRASRGLLGPRCWDSGSSLIRRRWV